MLHDFFTRQLPAVRDICHRYAVAQLYVFGSIVDGRFVEGKSDIDLLVELQPLSTEVQNQMLVHLWFDLEALFGCEVDLITVQEVQDKHFQKYLDLYKVLVFDAL